MHDPAAFVCYRQAHQIGSLCGRAAAALHGLSFYLIRVKTWNKTWDGDGKQRNGNETATNVS
jgi:hypothetical protein